MKIYTSLMKIQDSLLLQASKYFYLIMQPTMMYCLRVLHRHPILWSNLVGNLAQATKAKAIQHVGNFAHIVSPIFIAFPVLFNYALNCSSLQPHEQPIIAYIHLSCQQLRGTPTLRVPIPRILSIHPPSRRHISLRLMSYIHTYI